MDILHSKKEKLEQILKSYGKVAVAFSAGVDSTFLLKVAHDVLGDNAVAVTVNLASSPDREQSDAEKFCRENSIRQIKVTVDEFSIDGFKENPKDRCYICKKALFSQIISEAEKLGISTIVEGSNKDDEGDYRPGMVAIAELSVKSPLREAELTKNEIRLLSKELNLSTWDKPSFACLSTRIPYGEEITPQKLSAIEKAEQKLFDLGFNQFRVRVHGSIARIEIEKSDFEKFMKPEISENVSQYFHSLGFTYVSLDLDGYKTGSLNKTIKV